MLVASFFCMFVASGQAPCLFAHSLLTKARLELRGTSCPPRYNHRILVTKRPSCRTFCQVESPWSSAFSHYSFIDSPFLPPWISYSSTPSWTIHDLKFLNINLKSWKGYIIFQNPFRVPQAKIFGRPYLWILCYIHSLLNMDLAHFV